MNIIGIIGMHLRRVRRFARVHLCMYMYLVCFGHKPILGLMLAAKRKMHTVPGQLSSTAIVLKADVNLGPGGRLFSLRIHYIPLYQIRIS